MSDYGAVRAALLSHLSPGREAETLAGLGAQIFVGDAQHDGSRLSWPVLARLARASCRFIAKRQSGKPKVRIANPAGGASLEDITVIETINDDKPFLVDSITGFLNARGFQPLVIQHPVITVTRDESGALTQLHPPPGETVGRRRRESLIHIHIRRLADAADRQMLKSGLEEVLRDVYAAVADWRVMQTHVECVLREYSQKPPAALPDQEVGEVVAFLRWLLNGHFIFLGLRELACRRERETLCLTRGVSRGILRNTRRRALMSADTADDEANPQFATFLGDPAPVCITKSDLVSTVHRRVLADCISVKRYDEDGEVCAELRLIGLFTSSAYTHSVREIPLVRRKVTAVIADSGHAPSGHSGRAMLNVLENLPRDELFQLDIGALSRTVASVYRLERQPRTEVFIRRDPFGRFASALIYVPRERFNTGVRQAIGGRLAEALDGKIVSSTPSFNQSGLVRIHYIVARDRADGCIRREIDETALRADIAEIVRTWGDRLADALKRHFPPRQARQLQDAYGEAFSYGYQETFSPEDSLHDIRRIESMRPEEEARVHFYQKSGTGRSLLRLKLYRRGPPIALSELIPLIENLGLRAIEEQSFTLSRSDGHDRQRYFLHDVSLETFGNEVDMAEHGERLAACFDAVWRKKTENDYYNALVLAAGLDWRQAALLRAFGGYLRQIGAPYPGRQVAQTLVGHGEIARTLVEMFYARFAPGDRSLAERNERAGNCQERIVKTLQAVSSLDEDRILRRFANLIGAITRTNFFQRDGAEFMPVISFKIDSQAIENLPAPRPFAEIYVHAPDVEGIHLRGGPVARGGLRWSERRADFRTEILGLLKAQYTKNAVIIPVGAKGGFVVKTAPAGDAVFAEGKRAYQLFISSLLALTDNRLGEQVIPPENTVRYDGDDPYLVVAADKGTAQFSDTANAISQAQGFWLDDAFASGGSAGYDHKAMGITARGGWEAVKRHFRELGVDIQKQPFTVIGVGDMSGDVFGNALLASRCARLIAAFDHRDIFVDPDPDPAVSYDERKRLFEATRSSWQQYDPALISEGGGVFSRRRKAISLSGEIRALTGLDAEEVTPQELIVALLKAPVDLLWFGGIGTYVRARGQNDAEVGDRHNDALRVAASDLRAKVIGEGANLGITQLGRIEFAARGGRINTDAVDNSAGVNCSDVEVNIKIALSAAEQAGKLDRPGRNKLLAGMTDDVAGLVLRNNYLQTLCLSMSERQAVRDAAYLGLTLRRLEKRGRLDRRLENLPDDGELAQRHARGKGLTRPELSVLMAHAKLALFEDLRASVLPDDLYFETVLLGYFPGTMASAYRQEIAGHRLRREIIATCLANEIINRGGPSFMVRLGEETGRPAADIARAFFVASHSFGFERLNSEIDALDNRIDSKAQLYFYLKLQRLARRSTVWCLHNTPVSSAIEATIAGCRRAIESLWDALPGVLPPDGRQRLAAQTAAYRDQGLPSALAGKLAALNELQRAPDLGVILRNLKTSGSDQPSVEEIAAMYFSSGAALRLDRLMASTNRIKPDDPRRHVAINHTIDRILRIHREIVLTVLSREGGSWDRWAAGRQRQLAHIAKTNDDLLSDSKDGPDLAGLVMIAGNLAELVQGAA